jgi:hypothetical protein
MNVIQDFLKENTTTASLVRAKELLRNNLVRNFHFNKSTRQISAKVQGNNLYSVNIIFTGKKRIFTMCNCPYNYQGVCKHIVSVLIKFQEDHGDLKTDDIQKPILIHDFQALTKDDIRHVTGDQLKDPLLYSLSHNTSLASYNDGNEAVFHVPDYSYSRKNNVVRLKYTGEGVTMDCNCRSEFTFCAHKKAVLLYGLEVRNNPAYFNFLDPDVRKQKKVTFGKSYGIDSEEEADRHIKIVNSQGNLVYEFSKEFEGLLPIDEESYSMAKEEIFRLTKEILTPEYLLPEPIRSPDEHKKGFGLILTFDNDSKYLLSVDCFTAKYNKKGDRLQSNFERLSSEDQAEYSGKEKLLLELAGKTKVRKQYSTQLKPVSELQPVLRELFQLIDDDIHTYFQIGSYWNHDDSLKIRKSNIKEVHLQNRFYKIEFELKKDDRFIALTPIVILNDQKLYFNQQDGITQSKLPLFFEHREGLFLAQDMTTLVLMESLKSQPVKKMSAAHSDLFIKDFILPISENFIVNVARHTDLKVKKMGMKPIQKKLYISGMGQFVLFRPFVKYGDEMEVNILKQGNRFFYDDKAMSVIERDEPYEQAMHMVIKELHSNFKRQYPEEFYYLKVHEMTEDNWFFDAFEKLNDAGVEVLGLNELEHFKYNPYKASIHTKVSSGQDWFDVQIEVKFGDLHVSLQDVKKAVLKQNRYVRLSDGSLGILPAEWLERFTRMFRHGEVKGENLKISNRKFLIVDELFASISELEIQKDLQEKKKKLKAFNAIKKVKVPAVIQAELRHYQKEGLNWLNFLDEFQWGGILADDMGLGKTLQILTFLASQKSKKPSLIVVPTTLMFNWENEIQKFCPTMKAYFHYGPNRGKNSRVFKGHDVVITTYGMVTNDIEWLKEVEFYYLIIDESQAIKNPQSLRFKSVCLLKARNRIALTGTPIENNTFDLYAQMHFVNPGLLGNVKSFKEQYSQPIDRDGDSIRAAELRTVISPFIIRRTKEQVATELPPKTEDVIFCTMEPEQRKVYDAFRNKYRDMLMGKIDEDGLEKSKIYVIEGLMKLRQICDSPELLPGEENYGSSSIKVEELMRNIEEKTGNHKIVVFSQFVSMLKIIQKKLDHDSVLYEYLDGKSSKKSRQKSVERFQEDEKCRVFLISLKAGGTGLNLTAADYVFLVDPWWNPAVEEQAIDRTYRIGQDKKVFAYRMICKDTIEEKILNYQKKKKAIAADIIQAEESFMKQLTSADIKDLFS